MSNCFVIDNLKLCSLTSSFTKTVEGKRCRNNLECVLFFWKERHILSHKIGMHTLIHNWKYITTISQIIHHHWKLTRRTALQLNKLLIFSSLGTALAVNTKPTIDLQLKEIIKNHLVLNYLASCTKSTLLSLSLTVGSSRLPLPRWHLNSTLLRNLLQEFEITDLYQVPNNAAI